MPGCIIKVAMDHALFDQCIFHTIYGHNNSSAIIQCLHHVMVTTARINNIHTSGNEEKHFYCGIYIMQQ